MEFGGFVPYVAQVTSSTSRRWRLDGEDDVPESFRVCYHGETIDRNQPMHGGPLYYKIRPMKPSELRVGQIIALEPHLDETGEDGVITGERPCTLVRLLQIIKRKPLDDSRDETHYKWCYLEDEYKSGDNDDNNETAKQCVEHTWTKEEVLEEPADLWHIVPDESIRQIEKRCFENGASKRRKVVSDGDSP
eukprot:CAMPEP_0178902724 /NCGR_PEP_ID=MMETSP0786-20121207/4766_1 /TAXON_ID=186022 /ORGANISM="Thalassionema frauenfeldii, Strain CCMP 1798" /LENGTH=190 /DNA_ID=CAMNT_0020574027 /DNA_START=165 /DNA_END=737 /DNA_ORIENTATION=-